MDKKILLFVSVIASIFIILASFSSVVGFQTQKSTTINTSPLFCIRTSRAINEEPQVVTSDYIGKGIENRIYLPQRDSKSSQIYRLIKRISQIDDESIRFIIPLMNQVHQKNMISDENLFGLMNKLSQIRDKPEGEADKFIDELDNNLIGVWTIINPICLLIIFGFLLLFGVWSSIISVYLGITCDPCCYIPLPETLRI